MLSRCLYHIAIGTYQEKRAGVSAGARVPDFGLNFLLQDLPHRRLLLPGDEEVELGPHIGPLKQLPPQQTLCPVQANA